MRTNKYPALCSICRMSIEAGGGVLHAHGERWIVTHRTPCPSTEFGQTNARAVIRRSFRILDNPTSDTKYITLAASALSRLVATGWLDYNECIQRVLQSPATQRMGRLDVEELIERWIPEPARA